MNYRADIDGLRAIAIILVLIYHAGLSLFPSGFIGVDVFFVISGFLITGIIHSSLTKGHFSFIDFYNRRLWRLQPAFLCFLLFTILLSLVFFLPDDLIQFSKSARKTVLYTSNLFFNRTTTGYFSPDTQQLPLLHTWSLSIEWQCYLILPLAMYALHRLFKRHLPMIIGLLTILCFLLSLHYSKSAPAQTYYQFSSRMFEFLIGACIAFIPQGFSSQLHFPHYLHFFSYHPRFSCHPREGGDPSCKQSKKATYYTHTFINLLGLLALVALFYIATSKDILLGYPNWHSLIICSATALLIALGKFYPQQWVTRFLSLKPIVFIGLISYSLYLWHWPIFVMLNYQNTTKTAGILTLVFIVIFFLSFLSWKYIEKPARKFKKKPFHYTLITLVLVPIAIIHLGGHLLSRYDGIPQRFNQELVTVYQTLDHYASEQRPLCVSDSKSEINRHCLLGSQQKNAKKGLLIGDSFANHYWGFMDVLGKDANVSILTQTISACATLPDIYLYDWWHFKNQVYQYCHEQTEKYYQMIAAEHYDYVIIGQIWSNYVSDKVINKQGDLRSNELGMQRLATALDKALATIIASGAKPVIINTTALMQQNFHDCFFKHIKQHRPYDAQLCSFKLSQSPGELWLDELFATMQQKYPQLIFIDPKKVQCDKGLCKADVNGIPVYRDVGHITDYASYQFGEQYLKQYLNPLV